MKEKHYIVGSEGDAGGIVKRFLQRSGINPVCIDKKLGNALPSEIDQGSFLYIETPPREHAFFLEYALLHRLKVFIEKPLVYSVKELTELFEKNNCKVLKGGTRRNLYFIMSLPFRIISHWLKGKKLIGNIFWDLLGFAEFIYAQKGKIIVEI